MFFLGVHKFFQDIFSVGDMWTSRVFLWILSRIKDSPLLRKLLQVGGTVLRKI